MSLASLTGHLLDASGRAAAVPSRVVARGHPSSPFLLPASSLLLFRLTPTRTKEEEVAAATSFCGNSGADELHSQLKSSNVVASHHGIARQNLITAPIIPPPHMHPVVALARGGKGSKILN